eukprot:scaffold7316_cov123-Cylindrotheca_fusiformis.AAC.10
MTEEEVVRKKQCFTSIESRKLLGSMDAFHLCPSMDLVVFGSTALSKTHNLFRTVSWQQVALIHNNDVEESSSSKVCWSPNGRWIAVAHDTLVSLYGVEPLANPAAGASFGNGNNNNSSSTSSTTEPQHSWHTHYPVIGLSWSHVGRDHPTAWKPSTDEEEEDVFWSYQQHYLDKAIELLPPSAYHTEDTEDEDHLQHQQHHKTTTSTALPECKTPLSVLCVSTTHELEFYLHGRYPLLKVKRKVASQAITTTNVKMTTSNDLTHFVVYSEPSSGRVSFYHFPFLRKDRYPLQAIASLHSSIVSHLNTLQQSIPEVLNAWKSSLKPLDTKLQPLLRLLQNYGVTDKALGAVLKQFILVGHTGDSSELANAMDQFFTSVQMNDQLLQRMVRTLYGALANVESQARRTLLSPTQALVFQIQELSGFVQFYKSDGASPTNDILQELLDASHSLWISVEYLLMIIVESRFRVRDFCGYLRHAGSEIKARGTAAQSVQRENAKKRRVPEAVIERLLACLSNTKLDNKNAEKQVSLSEHILSISVSDMLKETPNFVYKGGGNNRPESPSSVAGLSGRVPTVAHATNQVVDAAKTVFVNPLANIPSSIVPEDVLLPSINHAIVALHTRVGKQPTADEMWPGSDTEDESEETEKTYFSPRVADHCYSFLPKSLDCRQWSIILQASDNVIQLFSFPLGWEDPTVDADDDADIDAPFYLTSKLVLPPDASIRDIGFYSDDGKSSLSSGNDSGGGTEGRQKLGILLEESQQLELWLTTYDSLMWQAVPYESILMPHQEVDGICCRNVVAIAQGVEDEELESEDCVVYAQSRIVGETDDSMDRTSSKLWLSGSRGVCGVARMSQGITFLELLDLEEHEFEDEDEEEYEDEDKD